MYIYMFKEFSSVLCSVCWNSYWGSTQWFCFYCALIQDFRQTCNTNRGNCGRSPFLQGTCVCRDLVVFLVCNFVLYLKGNWTHTPHISLKRWCMLPYITKIKTMLAKAKMNVGFIELVCLSEQKSLLEPCCSCACHTIDNFCIAFHIQPS